MKKTGYFYDDRSFRLNVLRTTRNNGQDTLQNLNYYYDAVGNIVGEADHAQQIFYFANQEVEPVFNYTYDPLYRLLTATGREMTALQMPTHEDFPNNIPCPNPGTDAMQNYTQNYQYDALGNMLQMSSQNQWTRDYIYDTATNRLLRHTQQLPDTYTYDAHGNMLTMPHLSNINWDYLDQLHSATNGTFVSYYNYDAEGNRTRKVVNKGNIREERYYVNGYEIYRKYTNDVLDFERKTINISDDEKVFVRIEQKTGENPVVRYQYDNHLGSACLELDELGSIISYEEYHPFGTTSYRSGRSETEVSLKRYKYCGKERDEETGLYYYGMRYYAAWLCRFVSVDPLQFKYPYYTPYQYAGNKPVTFIDLDGGEEIKPSDELKKEIDLLDVYNEISQTSVFKKIQKQVQTVVDYAKFERKIDDTFIIYPRGKSSGGVITINKNFYSPGSDYDKTVLGKTIIHELIHERLSAIISNYIFQKDGESYFRKSDFKKDYPGFAESVEKYGWVDDKESNRGWQHNWMATYGRDDIIKVMRYLDKRYSIIRGNKEYTANDWYTAISFAGLENTDAWNNLLEEQKSLYSKIINEAHEDLRSYSILLPEIKVVSRKNDTININVNDTIKN